MSSDESEIYSHSSSSSREVEMVYADGSSRVVNVTNHEVPFPEDAVIVSRTDPEGFITHANQFLVTISGYSLEELIGSQHNLLRHPDMPAAVFAEMWDLLKQGKRWNGYIKNRCKNGDYYWVKATVMPNIRQGKLIGYTSVRKKPSRSKVEYHEALISGSHNDG